MVNLVLACLGDVYDLKHGLNQADHELILISLNFLNTVSRLSQT